VSQRWCWHVPGLPELARDVLDAVAHHDASLPATISHSSPLKKATAPPPAKCGANNNTVRQQPFQSEGVHVVAHSFGTLVASHLIEVGALKLLSPP
jgi:hypothetical protein